MKTPICDFVREYEKKNTLRLHMPGHKGEDFIGLEKYDITEIDGADSLYEAKGIIDLSEKNATELFGFDTFYSTEGSSQCIRALVYLSRIYADKIGRKKLIFAGRNAHKSFVSAISLLDMDVHWLYSNDNDSYLSCKLTSQEVENAFLKAENLPVALYVTSPDYLGNVTDIAAISKVCKKYGVLLLCDNAHGAYLKFLENSLHPIDLGADMCCDSAHKTLPALTGAAYLHMGKDISKELLPYVKNSLSLFGSTSPSYLILQSLDNLNEYIREGYREKLQKFINSADQLKKSLCDLGYTLLGDEPLKITVATKGYGYMGEELANRLKEKHIICEFYDDDFVVLMLTPELLESSLKKIFDVFSSIEKKEEIITRNPMSKPHIQKMSVREAVMSDMEEVPLNKAEGRTLAYLTVACPPAVVIVSPGEVITKEDIEMFSYYKTEKLWVVK